jgi:NADPH:quinone reductase-like Zn-dependent oxidoreductase
MKKDILPKRMNAVFVDPASGKLFTQAIPVPVPGKGEVLVKMSSVPINPSDLARIRELTPEETSDFIPGVEGVGTVVAKGKGLLPALFIGRRVACSPGYKKHGTWAEYMVAPAGSCFPVGRRIPEEQAAMAIVNPMTALALLDIAKRGGHKAVVNTAAAGALGKMMNSLFERHGISVLNVVRHEEGLKKLAGRGVRHAMSTSGKDFPVIFKTWCEEMHASLVFDAVGGEFVNPVLPLLPAGSTIILYGNLSKQRVEFMPPLLVRENKQITGFFLGRWIHENGMLKALRNLIRIKKLLADGKVETPVQAVFPLAEVQQAMDTYEADMGGGKVLLKCAM